VVGGVERVIGEHARLMAADGHDVRLIVARGEAAHPGVELALEPLVDSLHPEVAAVQERLDAGEVPAAFHGLRDRIRAALAPLLEGRDVLIAHNVASLNKNLALTAALHQLATEPGGPTLVLWHHDLAWCLPRYRPTLHPGAPWDLLRTAWPGVTQVAISAVRRQELAALTGVPPATVRVIPNGVDLAITLGLDEATIELLRDTGLGAADPLLLMPSRILPRKRIGLGIRVVGALRARGIPAGVVVTGPADPHEREPGGYLARLRHLAVEEGVTDAAWMPGAERPGGLPERVMADLFALADVLFLPSRDEGFGIPVLEAALHRLPIVCADLAALREVADDAPAWIDPDAGPEAIADVVLAHLARDPLARLARHVRHEGTWDAVYARHIGPLLRSLAR
jgi:glycosyltransferase involved in cell wall biosynthesis